MTRLWLEAGKSLNPHRDTQGRFAAQGKDVQPRPWRPEEENYLRQNWIEATDSEVGRELGRKVGSVKKKRQKMGLTHWRET